MRLPGTSDRADLDVAVFGVPFDLGTSNRPALDSALAVFAKSR